MFVAFAGHIKDAPAGNMTRFPEPHPVLQYEKEQFQNEMLDQFGDFIKFLFFLICLAFHYVNPQIICQNMSNYSFFNIFIPLTKKSRFNVLHIDWQ